MPLVIHPNRYATQDVNLAYTPRSRSAGEHGPWQLTSPGAVWHGARSIVHFIDDCIITVISGWQLRVGTGIRWLVDDVIWYDAVSDHSVILCEEMPEHSYDYILSDDMLAGRSWINFAWYDEWWISWKSGLRWSRKVGSLTRAWYGYFHNTTDGGGLFFAQLFIF